MRGVTLEVPVSRTTAADSVLYRWLWLLNSNPAFCLSTQFNMLSD
ncbi:hypothetical protein APHNP_1001 [Anaplasma phagocytophilum str. ApNP]|uniref:Uncharacterized protein n=1 Tax=Anaplasma phagocytophilum str. ApNP TaxID=1359153 RepID=A0A0F3NJL2_ANAPH|nr:hypothetical protein APHNP_1001 [Anaplasma phagocytophilum str. ApNP]